MKKLLCVILALALQAALVSCAPSASGVPTGSTGPDRTPAPTADTATPETEGPTETKGPAAYTDSPDYTDRPDNTAYPDLGLRTLADDSFFSDAAILGNSLIEGLRAFSGLTADYYCGTSMSVTSALHTKDVPLNNGSSGTQLEAMAQKKYGKVYIELGINEIGGSVDTFIANYRVLLDQIRAAQPSADIYIMAITPTSRDKAGTPFSKERVVMYNDALYNLAAQWGCWYLDVFTPLADSEGYLAAGESWDGIHFQTGKYAAWEKLIRTHYA